MEAFHTHTGVLHPSQTPHNAIIHQILFFRGGPMFQFMLFIFHLIFTINLLFGYQTSISSILHFIFTISLHERNYYILNGGDRLFRHLSFWLIFLPAWYSPNGNTLLSIDAIHIQQKLKFTISKKSDDKLSLLNKGKSLDQYKFNIPDIKVCIYDGIIHAL